MQQASEETERKSSVIVQKTKICNYGEARYKLASALNGVNGYDLADDFKNAVRLLPLTYSMDDYIEFLDDWGTVSARMQFIGQYLQNKCMSNLLFPTYNIKMEHSP